MLRLLLFLLPVLGLLPSLASAQYHFQEVGLRFGGGTNIPTPFREIENDVINEAQSPWNLSWAYNANLFYSHYFCGKNYGYHIDLGVRGFNLVEDRPAGFAPTYFSPDSAGRYSYVFHYADLGVYFKVRRHNYNRRKEVALLFGPKLNVRFWSRVTDDAGNVEVFQGNDFRNVGLLVPGLQVSVWFRRKLGRNGSFFLIPGCDFYVLNTASTELGQNFRSIYPHLNLGFTFWNNR